MGGSNRGDDGDGIKLALRDGCGGATDKDTAPPAGLSRCHNASRTAPTQANENSQGLQYNQYKQSSYSQGCHQANQSRQNGKDKCVCVYGLSKLKISESAKTLIPPF